MYTAVPRIRGALLLAMVFCAPATLHAQITRCVDAQGNVSFTDKACPPGTTQQSTTGTARQTATRAAETAPGTGGDVTRQQGDIRERVDAIVREKDAQCRAGDQKACAEAVCARVLRIEKDASDFRGCATVQGFKSTASWAQMSEVREGDKDRRVQITCLTNPTLVPAAGETLKLWRAITLRANGFVTASHARDRWFASELSGPDFATWEEAATSACAP
jgi:hypothetical protein